MTNITTAPTSYRFMQPASTHAANTARTSFDTQVEKGSNAGKDIFAQAARLPKFVAKVAIGERTDVAGAQHTHFAWSEGAVGNALVTLQTILSEVGAIIGAVAGVLTAGGKAVVGKSTEGTISAHALAGKKAASLAAHVVTSPLSVVLNWSRMAVGEALKILPAVGTVVGGTAGTAIGSVTSVLTGLGALLNLAAARTPDAPVELPVATPAASV